MDENELIGFSQRTEVNDMMEFIMCIGDYLLKALFYVAVGGLGAFIGIKMRKSSDAKKAAAKTEE